MTGDARALIATMAAAESSTEATPAISALGDADPDWLDQIDDRRLQRERRASTRTRTLRGGRAFWPNGDSSGGTIRNISETGAQLEFSEPVPNRFDLVIEGETLRRSCAVVWRKDNRVGVHFVSPKNLSRFIERRIAGQTNIKQYIEDCEMLAQHVEPLHRGKLLDMAKAWKIVNRRLHGRAD
jgi:PilZ domain